MGHSRLAASRKPLPSCAQYFAPKSQATASRPSERSSGCTALPLGIQRMRSSMKSRRSLVRAISSRCRASKRIPGN